MNDLRCRHLVWFLPCFVVESMPVMILDPKQPSMGKKTWGAGRREGRRVGGWRVEGSRSNLEGRERRKK